VIQSDPVLKNLVACNEFSQAHCCHMSKLLLVILRIVHVIIISWLAHCRIFFISVQLHFVHNCVQYVKIIILIQNNNYHNHDHHDYFIVSIIVIIISIVVDKL